MREARRLLLRAARRLVHDAIFLPWLRRHREHQFEQLASFIECVGALRFGFGDRATLVGVPR